MNNEGDSAASLFSGRTKMHAACRDFDWSTTPLGPVDAWPKSLRAAVQLCLDSPIHMSVWAGPDLVLIYNDSYATTLSAAVHPGALGRPARQALSQFWDWLGPELDRLMHRGESLYREDQRLVTTHAGRDDEAFFTYSFTPIREPSGAIVGALNIVQESTERARRIVESEQFLSFALSTAKTGAWELDLGDHTARRSLEHDQIFGYDELLPTWTYETFLEHVLPEDRPEVDRRYREARATGGDWSFECRITRLDGEVRWIWAAGRHRRDSGAEPRLMAGIIQDITDRRRAEEALKRSRDALRAVVDAAPAAVLVADREGRFLLTSAATERILGGTPTGDAHGPRRGYPIRRPDGSELPPGQLPISRALANEVVVDEEIQILRADGTQATILGSATPLHTEDGAVDGAVMILYDLSERARAEEALREANARLMEADRRKNEFLAVLSHELRNPLAPIRNSVYILEHAAPGGEQAIRARQVLDRQARHLARLIDDLLDLTRISRGKVALQKELLDLNELARGTAEDHREMFQREGVALEVTEAGEPIWVHGDRTRLAQIIGNLLTNSAKFTPRGGQTVLTIESVGRRQAAVRVRDNGAGMTPETQAHLFEPFAQAAQTIERTRGGLGLGLALVKGLVEMHSGTVTAQSEGEGKGSEFVVTFPLSSLPSEKHGAKSDATVGKARRVLVIEDNVDSAESLRDVLELNDHEVRVAYSGPEGLEAARAETPDVVLCDIGLPGIDGYDVARSIRQDSDSKLRRTFLVALSGYALPEDIVKSKKAGFDRHIAKPPSIEALEEVIEEAWHQRA